MDELVRALKKYFNKYILKPLFEDVKAKRISFDDLLLNLISFKVNVKDMTFESISELLGILRERIKKPDHIPLNVAVEMMIEAVSTAAYNYLKDLVPVFEAALESEEGRAFGPDWAQFRSKFFLPDNHPGIDDEIKKSLQQYGFTVSAAKQFAKIIMSYLWSENWAEFCHTAARIAEENMNDTEYNFDPSVVSEEGPHPTEFLVYDPQNPSAFIKFVNKYKPKPGETYIDRYTKDVVTVTGLSMDGQKVKYKYKDSGDEETDHWTFFLRHFVKSSRILQEPSLGDRIVQLTCRALRKTARKWFEYISGPCNVDPVTLTKHALLGIANKPCRIVFAENARDVLWIDDNLETVWDLLTQSNYNITKGSRQLMFTHLEQCIDNVLT